MCVKLIFSRIFGWCLFEFQFDISGLCYFQEVANTLWLLAVGYIGSFKYSIFSKFSIFFEIFGFVIFMIDTSKYFKQGRMSFFFANIFIKLDAHPPKPIWLLKSMYSTFANKGSARIRTWKSTDLNVKSSLVIPGKNLLGRSFKSSMSIGMSIE